MTISNIKNHIISIFKPSSQNNKSFVINPNAVDKTPQTDIFELSDKNFNMDDYKLTSKTMEKLYSPEFYIKPEKNKDGYYRTTVINNETGKPEVIYIKRKSSSKDCYIWQFYDKKENYYNPIGVRTYLYIDNHINPGFMANSSQNKYTGIGLRGHQLAVETAIKNNAEKINVSSLPKAFIFHHKCGFKASDTEVVKSQKEFDKYIKKWANGIGESEETMKKAAVYKLKNNNVILKEDKTNENFMLITYSKHLPYPEGNNVHMELSGEELNKWKKLASEYPITLGAE